MKIFAVYRCLYGEDFVQESIKSILPYVEHVFVFWDDMPWGNVHQCQYKDWNLSFAERKFDKVVDRIDELNSKKIHLIYNHMENNENQFTRLINEKIKPVYGNPDLYIMPEVDHIQRKDQIEGAIAHIMGNNIRNASTTPIEMWRSYKYRIPERHRMCTILWNMNGINELPTTGRQANSPQMQFIPFNTWNFGLCYNPATMFWKHVLSMAFSSKIGDDLPGEGWYEKWLTWTPTYNNSALEISKGYEANISHAFEYDVTQLPELIKEKYGITK